MSRIAHESPEPQSFLNPDSKGGPRSLRSEAYEQGLLIERSIKQSVVIPYQPALCFVLGDIYAAIFLQQIFYRFKGNQYRPFYKFIFPCTNEFYRKGDSWLEELVFTRRQIQRAINKVSTRISATKKCKRQDRNEVLSHTIADLDETGKMANSNALILYWFTRDHMTWWTVNTPLLLHTLQIAQSTNTRFVNQSLIESSSGPMRKMSNGLPHAEITNRENHNRSFRNGLSSEKEPHSDGTPSTSLLPEIVEYVDVVAQICCINMNLCSPLLESEVIETAKHFRNASRTFKQIVLIGHWWRHHFWKGQRGTPPRPNDLLDIYGAAESFYMAGEGGNCCKVFIEQWRS